MPTTTNVIVVQEDEDGDDVWRLIRNCCYFTLWALFIASIILLIGSILSAYFFWLATAIPIVYACYLCFWAKKRDRHVDWVRVCCLVFWIYNVLRAVLGAKDIKLEREHPCCCPDFNPCFCVEPDPDLIEETEVEVIAIVPESLVACEPEQEPQQQQLQQQPQIVIVNTIQSAPQPVAAFGPPPEYTPVGSDGSAAPAGDPTCVHHM